MVGAKAFDEAMPQADGTTIKYIKSSFPRHTTYQRILTSSVLSGWKVYTEKVFDHCLIVQPLPPNDPELSLELPQLSTSNLRKQLSSFIQRTPFNAHEPTRP
jgi:hypothetical protein